MTLPIRTSVARSVLIATSLLGAVLAGGCKPKPTDDATAKQVAQPIKLPPPISRSATYRCKDDSLVYVDYFADQLSVNFHTTQNGPIHHLVAAASDRPFTGDGYSLSRGDKTVQFSAPGGAAQSCKS